MRNRRLVRSAVLVSALAVACLGAGAGMARATDITLDVSGTLVPSTMNAETAGTCPMTCTLGGTLVINNTTGTFVSADVTVSGESPSAGPFTTLISEGNFFGEPSLVIGGPSVPGDVDLILMASSLVGYDGGRLDVSTEVFGPIVSGRGADWVLKSGSGALTPEAATPTPEPSSMLLLALGMLGVLALRLFGERLGLRH